MNKKDIFHLFLFLVFWLIFFRKIVIGMVPLPGNLLVWFFSPWKEESWPQYPGGVPKQGLFGFDTIRQIYPWRSFTTEQLLNFQWPLWNPYQFSGAPHLANFQTAIFNPLALIYLILPQIYAWTILFLLQPLLAGFFMYLLARKLELSRLASFLAAFSYAFSLTMSVWLIWNIHAFQFAFLPLIFYLIESYKQKKTNNYLLFLFLVLVLTFFTGHPQIAFFIFVFGGFYFFYRIREIKRYLFLIFWLLLVTAVAWLPLLEYYRLASREITSSEFNYEKTLLPWVNLITLLAPDFLGNPTTANHFGKIDYTEGAVYLGIVGLVFSILTFTSFKKKKFFIFSVPLVLALCLDWFLPKFLNFLKIPFLTSSTATRVLFLVTFSLSVLAGFGLDEFLKKKKFPKIVFLPAFIYFLIFAFLFLAPHVLNYQSWFENLRVMKRNLVLPSVVYFLTLIILGLVFKFKNLRKLLYLLFLLAALDLFYVANKVIPFTYKELVFPDNPLLEFLRKNQEYYRFVGSQPSDFESNFATYYKLFSVEGYDTLYPRYYGELIWAGREGSYKEDISRTTVVFPPAGKNKYRKKLEDLLGIKYILKKDDQCFSENCLNNDLFSSSRYRLVWQRKNWKIYENLSVLPRAFLVGEFIVLNQKKEIIEKIYKDDFNPLKTVILEEEPDFKEPLDNTGINLENTQSKILKYKPTEVEIETFALGNKILFLSDTYYPGWQVYIDKEKSKIYKANYAFRAVFVPAGQHRVIFKYQPFSFNLGLGVSLFSSILALIFWVIKLKIKKIEKV